MRRTSFGCCRSTLRPGRRMCLGTFSSSCWRHFAMAKKLSGKALADFEAGRNVWQEVLDGVREVKAGGGKRTKVKPQSQVVRVRLNSGLSQAQFAAALGVSKRTL